MKEKLKILFWFILPIFLCLPQFVIGDRYETAKASGYEIDAVVVDYNIEKEYVEYVGESDVYELYVDYQVDGKQYKNIRAGEFGECSIGDTIKVVVNPKNPEEVINDGDIVIGFMNIAGLTLGTVNIIKIILLIITSIKERKNTKK